MAFGGGAQGVECGVAPIRHDAQVAHLAAQTLQQRFEEKSVAVVDGAGAHGFGRHIAGHDQLVAGRQQRHAGAAHHRQIGAADARRQPQLGRAQALTLAQHHRATRHVFAGAANPLSGLWHRVDAHTPIVERGYVFLHHHRIGARR